MDLWIWVVVACTLSFLVKFSGYLLPDSVFDNPRVVTTANFVTIGMLAALVVTNTFASGQQLGIDTRVAALLAALVALAMRAPFLVVIVVGAAAAAITRLIG